MLVAILGAVLAAVQRPFAPAVFEYGTLRTIEGTIERDPIPTLVVPRPGRIGETPAVSRYLLTVFGKQGADAVVVPHVGRVVQVDGTLIHRDGRTMVEIAPGGIRIAGGVRPAARSVRRTVGEVTLVGEIVDSKCFLGVMNPGERKPHRACAARCIAGGVPPLFVVRDRTGTSAEMVLVGADAEPIHTQVLPLVAEPVEIRGVLEQIDDLWILRAHPSAIRRAS